MQFDLEQFIFALSDTVDLVGVDETLHGKRVAYMAYHCAEAIGFDENGKRKLLHLGMLHDCGVSSTEERDKLIDELEWNNADIHCQAGAERLASFSPLKELAAPIRYHHTRWENLLNCDLTDNVRNEANLLYLLDRVDYLLNSFPGKDMLAKKDLVRPKIDGYGGTYFSRDLTDIFLDISSKEAFWFGMEPLMLRDFIDTQRKLRTKIAISLDQLKAVAELFAQIVDAKSPYTAEHSFGVSALAGFLAKCAGIGSDGVDKVKISGLLHDLGKLQVPDHILASDSPLNTAELSYMRHHSYASYRILGKISGLEDVATWAGNHHEALDGSGYPFRKTADQLDTESRVIAIADIFQALAQNRPYRKARPLENIMAFMHNHVDLGKIDGNIVALVEKNRDTCYQLATSPQT